MSANVLRLVGIVFGLVVGLTIISPTAIAQTCGPNNTNPTIAGTYVDNFGGLQAISTDFWVSGPLVFEICSVNQAKKQILARNNDRNEYNPGKFSRFDWTESGNRLWYCQTVYNAATLADAKNAAPPDPSDPANTGCGTFAWSTLIKLLSH